MGAALRSAAPRARPRRAEVDSITDGLDDLAIAHYDKIRGLRHAIVRLDRRRARTRRNKELAVYAAGTPEAERTFFRRFHVRKGAGVPASLPGADHEERSTAERLARDWRPMTQRGATETIARDDFFLGLPQLQATQPLAHLDAVFTEEEVRTAIKACPRGKAPGPEGLANDWYLEHADALAPVFTSLCNQWHRQRTLPVNFRHATVACIPKTSTPQTGLDFRPIALLDTDYKIYARLLLHRVSPALPELVASTRFGSGQGRQVHDTLDIFHGLQTLEHSQQPWRFCWTLPRSTTPWTARSSCWRSSALDSPPSSSRRRSRCICTRRQNTPRTTASPIRKQS